MSDDEALTNAAVAVVIVNYRTPALTEACLAALVGEREIISRLRVMVVDGGSADGSAERLSAVVARPEYAGWVSLLSLDLNGGFGWANNQAILALAKNPEPPDFIHLLNPDAEVCKGAVACLVRELLENPNCGAVGSQLLTRDGTPAASAFRFPSIGRELVAGAQSETVGRLLLIGSTVVRDAEKAEADWVTGASVLFRREALQDSGLFDDGFFLYFEEVELMHRLRKRGWTVRQAPTSRVMHIEGASTGIGASARDRPRPAYWYRSRRRYFARTEGAAVLVGANLALLLGKSIALLKRASGKESARDPVRVSDLWRFGFLASKSDRFASYPRWGDNPGKPPSWMAAR